MTEELKIVTRPAKKTDKDFILSTWLKGNYYGNNYFWYIPQEIYFNEYAKVITSILFNPEVEINVACDKTNPAWIAGYAVLKRDSIYWIYVRRDYRNTGIATLLLKGREINFVKSITRISKPIAERKFLVFNPF